MTILIPLWRGRGKKAFVIAHAVVDDDMGHLLDTRWFLSGGYAVRLTDEPGKVALMHRDIVGCIPTGMHVSHLNADKFDNRRSNLSVVTASVNRLNPADAARKDRVVSPYRGVARRLKLGRCKWYGRVRCGTKTFLTKDYDSPEEANVMLVALRKSLGIILDDGTTNPNLTNLELP